MQPRYDVFISYHADDQEWVRQTLLPGLERAGLRICVAGRDFAIGVPHLINIEQAIAQSHKTLLVITPRWLADQWRQFEALIVQTTDLDDSRRRVLPLVLQ